MPKTPDELREQIEEANEDRPADDHSRTAEGMKTSNPTRDAFFGNLEKASKPKE